MRQIIIYVIKNDLEVLMAPTSACSLNVAELGTVLIDNSLTAYSDSLLHKCKKEVFFGEGGEMVNLVPAETCKRAQTE